MLTKGNNEKSKFLRILDNRIALIVTNKGIYIFNIIEKKMIESKLFEDET